MSAVKETRLGDVRPSQLVYTYGVGQVVDLPQMSGMLMGLDDWPVAHLRTVLEERLLADVRRLLGDQVERLVAPPVTDDDAMAPFSPTAAPVIGVPVAPFPRYLRCSFCRLLAPIGSGLFRLQTVPRRPDLARYLHVGCNKARMPRVLPARFLFACDAGHLDDFPWLRFVHGPGDGCPGPLELLEMGFTGEAADVVVRCRQCGKKSSMAQAFGEDAAKNLPKCTARRPHLRDYEDSCSRPGQAILLGASNLWFGAHRTALHVPSSAGSRLAKLVERYWVSALGDVEDVAVLRFLRKQGKLAEFVDFTDEQLFAAIEKRRAAGAEDDEGSLKAPEWRAFAGIEKVASTPDFDLHPEGVPKSLENQVVRVSSVKRLRAVTALVGFSRVMSPRDFSSDGEAAVGFRAPLSRSAPRFVPATEVRGEGVFLQFQEKTIGKWLEKHEALDKAFLDAHIGFRRARQIEPENGGYPGLKYVLLHTLSHVLMRELALECGYAAASIRERIYANDDPDQGPIMAGVLLYTSAPDSEGTLGGLVRMAQRDRLAQLVERALEAARLCSSDPLCAEHRPEPRALHGAACHACAFAPETSCEAGNRYLDRGTVIETVAGTAGFFVR